MLFINRLRAISQPRHRVNLAEVARAHIEHPGVDDNWAAELVRAGQEQDAENQRAIAEAMCPTDEQYAVKARLLIRELQAQTNERRWLIDGAVPNPELPYYLLDGLPELKPDVPVITSLPPRRAKREARDPDVAGWQTARGRQSNRHPAEVNRSAASHSR